jgi:hypothetical protein
MPELNARVVQYLETINQENDLLSIISNNSMDLRDDFDRENSNKILEDRSVLISNFSYLLTFLSDSAIQMGGNIEVAKAMGDYLVSRKVSTLMREDMQKYNVPFIDERKGQLLKDLTSQFGSKLEKHRQSDWSMTYRAELPSSLLKKDIRDQLDLDRVAIVKIDEKRQEFLQENIPDITMEDGYRGHDPNKTVLLTCPLSEHARQTISIVTTPSKWIKVLFDQRNAPNPSTSQQSALQVAQEVQTTQI